MFLTQRQKYVRAMLKAIDKARQPTLGDPRTYSRTFGLRVIKRFRKANNHLRFNPFDEFHVETVTGMASNEHLFWIIKRDKRQRNK